MRLRFTIKNDSRYGRLLETLGPWQLLDALRWGFSRRQVSCGDMVNADTCRDMDDTFRLAEYDKARAQHVPAVEVRVQGPVSLVVFEWADERDGNNGSYGNDGE